MRITPKWKITHDRPVVIAEGVMGPSRVAIDVEDYEGFDLTVTVVFAGGRYECEELCVRRQSGGDPVTGEAVRSIPMAGIIRHAVWQMLMRTSTTPEGAHAASPLGWEIPPDLAAGGPTDDALRLVARVYKISQALGQPPTQSVQKDLGLPRSTAGRWISLARKRGLLDPPPVKQYPQSGDATDGTSLD